MAHTSSTVRLQQKNCLEFYPGQPGLQSEIMSIKEKKKKSESSQSKQNKITTHTKQPIYVTIEGTDSFCLRQSFSV